jgi:PilZ domain
MPAERRRWPRIPMEKDAEATLTADGWRQPCRILDFGPGGARIHLDGAPPFNLESRLEHPAAGTLYATRAWVEPGVMGIAFDSPERARAFLSLWDKRTTLRQSA